MTIQESTNSIVTISAESTTSFGYVSESMQEKVSEMKTGTSKISETGSALDSISKSTADIIERIGSEIDQFKV